MIIVLGAGGIYSYFNLGRAEDPSFTIKVMIVNVAWPGATASEMQTQVADKIEKKLQELPYLDRIESYSQPGVSFIQVFLIDRTPPAKVKDLWYQVRKKAGDIARVKRGYEDPPTFIVREAGKPALALGVSMQDGANIVTLGENLKQAMDAVIAELPVGIEVTQIADQPRIVEGSVSEFV